jgi:multiple sugar transport system permease protein
MNCRLRSKTFKRVALWALLGAAVVFYGFPYVYLVLTSFKSPGAALEIPPQVWPSHFTFTNYSSVLEQPGIVKAFVNSIVIAVLATAISVLLAVPAAYGVVRYRTRAGRVFVTGALVVRMVPAIAIGVPFVGLMARLHLTDTQLGVALAHITIALPLSIWLMSSFFEATPMELEESARIDGCSRLGALARVIVPITSGGIAVTAVFAFLASWNDFLFALLLTAQRSETVPVMIGNFQTEYGNEWASMTALAVLYSLPVVVATLLFQRKIVSGLTLGAVKG